MPKGDGSSNLISDSSRTIIASHTPRLLTRFFLLSVLTSVAASAQYMGAFGVPYNNPVSATLSTNVWNNWTIYQLQQKKLHGSQGSVAGGSAASSSAPSASESQTAQKRAQAAEASLKFRPSGTRLLAPKLVETLGKTQAQKEQVAAILTAIFQEFDKQAIKLGKPNDLAFALSYFLAQNATLYRGRPDPQDEQFLELRETIVAAMGQNNAFAKLTDQQKQEMHEMLVSYTGLVYLTYQDAKKRGDVETVKTMRELAGINLKAITHIEPQRINFTEQGLTIRP
ncbi:MAG TPA: DUF6683 family protein [Alphaproteobacteria bacterium]|nr:DUF6683 family protein [Alphaproteobacteria bacterium]